MTTPKSEGRGSMRKKGPYTCKRCAKTVGRNRANFIRTERGWLAFCDPCHLAIFTVAGERAKYPKLFGAAGGVASRTNTKTQRG